ncbi:MAG: hypothetical protein ACXWT6_16975, partial [Methylobacter tundripaludum]
SVRKARSRVRITGQLIDAATGTHLWADHFEGDLGNVFDLQDQVAASVVGAIAPKLERAEVERAKRKPTESLDAYDYYLRGWASAHQLTRETNDEALRQFSAAIELDPEFAAAHGMAAWCFVMRKANGWMLDRAPEIAQTERLALKAVDPAWEFSAGSSSFPSREAGASLTGFPSGSLGTSVTSVPFIFRDFRAFRGQITIQDQP